MAEHAATATRLDPLAPLRLWKQLFERETHSELDAT